jgi:hypothetical protein
MSHPIWITPSGSLGTYPQLKPMQVQLEAIPDPPATSVTYTIISGQLPNGLSMTINGLIYGTPDIVNTTQSSVFVVRAIDDVNEIRDRTFEITISGNNNPNFITAPGSLFTTYDSVWKEFPVLYNNPVSTNPVTIRVIQGELPPGLEINSAGLIRGYAEPPTTTLNLGLVTTSTTATSSTNVITCLSTTGFSVGRPIVFDGTVFGGIVSGTTYFVREVISATEFTISNVQDGAAFPLSNAAGFMTTTLPNITGITPTIRQYSFTLQLESPLGNDIESYFITVTNHYLPTSQGGPNPTNPPNTRQPTIYNTRPQTYDIEASSNYGYYVLPPADSKPIEGMCYNPSQNAYIGKILSNNYFSFHFLGKDFDGNQLTYYYSGLPNWLTGDPNTGWVYGEPIIDDDTISEFSFSVYVAKTGVPLSSSFAKSPTFNFTVKVTNDIDGDIIWITPSDLGEIYNSTISLKSVKAESDVPLLYRLTSDSNPLPNNLTLLDSGEITGMVAYQPSDIFLAQNDTQTFSFTVEAYSPNHPIVTSTKTFTLTVIQQYAIPTDNLYIKCTPSIENRDLIRTLLDNQTIIPNNALYRPNDIYFGKAQNIIYQHAFGIDSSDLAEYVEAVRKQHYWRNITLGEIKTAIARDENNNIVYEVVYSEVIDNLINPKGQSVSYEVTWPRTINLNKGPWYTSVTDIYTSYEYLYDVFINSQTQELTINTQLNIPLLIDQGLARFYTSLDPGEVRRLYPNSLPNMRQRVQNELGSNPNFRLLPLWMTSQQENGNTLGFTPAWVICYTKPGFAKTIKNNIETKWVDFLGNPIRLNQINFRLDRFTVDKSLTYDYDKNIVPPAWTGLPSATPAPDPIDSENFYVLFPRKTILPDSSEY